MHTYSFCCMEHVGPRVGAYCGRDLDTGVWAAPGAERPVIVAPRSTARDRLVHPRAPGRYRTSRSKRVGAYRALCCDNLNAGH
eukprot:1474785-Rhodomonas_salina.1